jgi:hypothetical protein
MARPWWVQVLAFGALLVAVTLGGFVLWQRGNYHQWPWQSLPDRVDHCDRSYAPGDDIAANDAPKLKFDFHFTPALAAHHDVYLEPGKFFTNDKGEQCPMGYFMKHGSYYQVYGLLGGP